LKQIDCETWLISHERKQKVSISKEKKEFHLLKCPPFAKEKFCENKAPSKNPCAALSTYRKMNMQLTQFFRHKFL